MYALRRCVMLKEKGSKLAVLRLSLALLVTLAASLVASVQDVESGTKRAQGTSVVWNQSGSSVPAQGGCANLLCVAKYWIPNGNSFQMICYGDTVNQKGNYYSSRWFWGYFTRPWSFTKYWTYIHSSYVYYQTSVSRC